MARVASLLAAAALAASYVTAALPLSAQSAPDAKLATAQDAYRHALALFDRGNYSEALAEFQRADALAPSFRILYNMALCQVALQDARAAVESFNAYLQGGAERISAEQRGQVQAEIARLTKLLGRLSLDVEERGAEVSVDGVALGRGPLERPVQLNAGRHTIEVRSPDGTLKTQSVLLEAGAEQRLHFAAPRLNLRPSAVVSAQPTPERDEPKAADGSALPWLAWGVTGALGVSAAVTGGLALGAHSAERDAHLRQGVSHAELVAARDKVHNLALATDILLVGSALSGGLSLYLTLRSGRSAEPRSALVLQPGALLWRSRF